jgi:hypothetical protein
VIDKLDVFRISEPMFRIHSRLFRVQEAILRASKQQIRASKLSVISQAAGLSGLFTVLLTLTVEIFHIDWLSAPVLVLVAVAGVAILIQILDYITLKEDEGKFEQLLSDVGGEDAETWVDYAEQLIAAYGSRLKMLIEAREEMAEAHKNGQITEDKFNERSEYVERTIAFCIKQLLKYREANERLYKEGKRKKEDYESVLVYLETAQPRIPKKA